MSRNYTRSRGPPATDLKLCPLSNGSGDVSGKQTLTPYGSPKKLIFMKASKKTDRRVQRSQQALQDALLQLMLEKGYADTSVSDIVDRANVGRSTFYAHYADKEDLLQQSLQGLRDFLTDETIVLPERRGRTHPALSFALPMFLHAYEQRTLFRSIMGARSGAPVQEHLQSMLTDLVLDKLRQEACDEGDQDEVPNSLRAEFIVGAFLAVLLAWIAEPADDTPLEMERKFRGMVLRGPLLRGSP